MNELFYKVEWLYQNNMDFMKNNFFVFFVFEGLSIITMIIISFIMIYESGMPEHFFNSWLFLGILIVFFYFFIFGLIMFVLYIITKDKRNFFLIANILNLGIVLYNVMIGFDFISSLSLIIPLTAIQIIGYLILLRLNLT
ncbi:hypothetical protein A9255_04175 [Xenorhabdus hominickii]|uniref:Uncharacterized protein n=1 Tax=Xenorhabdus hominickii TaxID=351679 RepID=A0A2G0Q350_XENHO|nr:hypothetical protein A9255_04175 [Xenorhabdus hominickii]PHM53625.1 hypothetical protein Xhom_03624 [Xenorhabdus hominickii]